MHNYDRSESHSKRRVLKEVADLCFAHRERISPKRLKQDLIFVLDTSIALAHGV